MAQNLPYLQNSKRAKHEIHGYLSVNFGKSPEIPTSCCIVVHNSMAF